MYSEPPAASQTDDTRTTALANDLEGHGDVSFAPSDRLVKTNDLHVYHSFPKLVETVRTEQSC